MPFDSGGVWSLTPGYLAVTGQLILPSNHNPPLEDIALNGLSAVLVRDGRAPMTGNLNMGNNRITNLSPGLSPTDAATVAQIISPSYLGGTRNNVINGDFVIWQRALTQTVTGFGSDDRWFNGNLGSTKTASQQVNTIGQTSVPGNPQFFSRTVVSTVACVGNFCNKQQRMEDVRFLQGLDVTVTFWAKADSSKNIALEMIQSFGTGGSPSADVTAIGTQLIPLTTAWQKITRKITLPSITGKTIGTTDSSYTGLNLWFDAGSNFNARTSTLGQQSGTFDISHVSVVVGDATLESDPFSPRQIQQELSLCERYCQKTTSTIVAGYNVAGNIVYGQVQTRVPMRGVVNWTFSNISSNNATALAASLANQYLLRVTCTVVATGYGWVLFDILLDSEL